MSYKRIFPTKKEGNTRLYHQIHHRHLKKRKVSNDDEYLSKSDTGILMSVENNDDMLEIILSFLDIVSLLKKKRICKRWEALCTLNIDKKSRVFEFEKELKDAIRVYNDIKHNYNISFEMKAIEIEPIASIYGWPICKWNVSQIRDFSNLFSNMRDFNEDIGSWDTSNVENMNSMFFGASSFNQDMSSWNTSKVQNMQNMFTGASSFNQDISSWNTTNVRNMRGMFLYASSFNKNISSWNTSNTQDMADMFWDASSFNQNISSWNTSKVQEMQNMFTGASLFNQDISSWNTSNVQKMRGIQMSLVDGDI